MEIGSFFGVPAHPLFVHLPVVLTPMAALVAWFMLRSEWRKSYCWVVAVLSGVALFGAQLAVVSGEELEERLPENPALHLHAELGEASRTLIAVFFAISLAVVLYDYIQKRRTEGASSRAKSAWAAGLTVAMILMGSVATAWVVRTGHQGAKITWEDVSER
jgi:uncharacterized membrane protein